MSIQILDDQQREFLKVCAEQTARLVALLPELEAGKATADQKAEAIKTAEFLKGTGDNVAYLAETALLKLDPITPGNMYAKMLHAEQPQPPCFTSDRAETVETPPGEIPPRRWFC